MKNLKKILMALVLVALLVSSVVTIAVADASYTGDVETAQQLLNAAYEAEAEADAKAAALKSLYTYLVTVNPQDDGYAEVKAAYNDMTFKVMHTYFEEYGAATTDDARSAVLTKVYAYKTAAPVILGNSSDVTYSLAYVCETCGSSADFKAFEFFNGLAADLQCPGTCSADDCVIAYSTDPTKLISYVEFEKEFNSTALSVVEQLAAYLFSLEEIDSDSFASYYDLLNARKEITLFLEAYLELEYEAEESALYTGSVSTASDFLKGITASSDFGKLKSALASAYAYLVENPVNPTSDEYFTFITKYNALADALILNLESAVDAATTPEAKFAELLSFREFLAGDEGTQISEKVVKAYNALRSEVIVEYKSADLEIDNLEALDVVVPEFSYSDDLTAFAEKIAAIEAAIKAEEEIIDLLVDLYNSCLSEYAYNPEAEGYAELISKYIAICDAYVNETYVAPIYESELVSDQLAYLIEYRKFVSSYLFHEGIVDTYNEIREEICEKLNAYATAFDEIELPEYVAPVKKPTMASEAVLLSFLEILTDSIDEYNNSTGEDKLAALEDMKRAAKELRIYTLGVDLDVTASYYDGFVAAYSNARDQVASILFAIVESAEDDKVLEELEAVGAFFEEVPLSFSSVASYNGMVDRLVDDADVAAEMKVDSVYYELAALLTEIFESEDVDELRDLGAQLIAYEKIRYDVTDEAYAMLVGYFSDSYKKIANAIHDDIIASINAADAEDIEDLIYSYVEYAEEVYSEDIIGKTNEALTAVDTLFAGYFADVSENNKDLAAITTVYEQLLSLIADFDALTDVNERFGIVETLYSLINYSLFNTAFICGDSYESVVAEYERVIAEFEADLIDMMSADASAYDIALNLRSIYEILTALPLSNEVVDVYNEVYESVCDANFGQYVENVDTECPAIDKYVTPTGWYTGLTRINIALDQSVEGGEIDINSFNVAYVILAGKAGVNGPKVIDFGVQGFFDTLTAFDNIKQEIILSYEDALAAADTVDLKKIVLEDLGSFIEQYPFSKKLVDAYNDIRMDIRDAFSQDSNATFKLFQALVNKIHAQLAACPIDVKYLSDYEKSILSIGESLLAAAEFSVVENYLEVAMGIGGENALIYQNIAVDELNASIGSFSLGDFNEQLLAKSNLQFAFVKYLEAFDAELATLSESKRADKIAATGASLVSHQYPAYLINLYNLKYGTNRSAQNIEDPVVDGNLYDYSEKLAAVMNASGAANTRVALDAFVEYVNGHKFSTEDTSGDLVEKLEEVKKALAEATKEQIDALDKLVSSEETGFAVEHNYDYENGKCNFSSAYNTGDSTAKVVTDSVTGNKYAELDAHTASSLQYLLKINDASQGIVLDFDIMSKGDLNFLIYFYGDSKQTKAIEITNGVIQNLSSYPNYTEDINFTHGEWTHITIAFDVQNQTQELYIDYVSLGKITINAPAARFQGNAAGRVKPFANKAAVNIDNFKVYHGTAYRTLGKLSTMDDDDKFALYMENLLNEEAKATDRLAAYYSAQNLKAFVTEKSAELKEKLEKFDITDIKAEAEAIHLAKIKELVDKVGVDSMTTANTAAAETAISAANAYIELNRLYVDQMSPEFRQYNQTLIDAADKIQWLANLGQYIEVIKKFHRATSYASLTKHLENVTHYYELCELYSDSTMEMASKDPVAQTFTAEMLKDASVIELVPDFTFASYYYEYIPLRLAAQLAYENSVKIVDCIEFIDALIDNKDQLTADAYKAALLEAAEENFDYVDSYVTIIRKIIISAEYDETVEGMEHALVAFEILDNVFFEALQNKHFEVIKAQLDKYAETNSYIERAGICTFLRNYIEENEVDMSGDEGSKYLYALKIYEEELEGYMKDYEAILAENTEAFLGVVKKMQAFVTYSELKPLYDEAISKYYYNMNVDSDEVKAAVAIFAEYEAKIVAWEENSALFLGYAKTLNSANRMAQKFRALVRCSNYVDGVDEGVEGVRAALELYARKLAEYNASIEPTIKEAADASNVVSALRTNRLSATVLAIANAIINK